MKLFRLTLSMVALLAMAITASAQQVSTGTAQGGGATVVPKGKIAVINTTLFQDAIGEFKAKIETLNRQFESRIKEAQALADRITALENQIKSQNNVLAPAKIAEMTEQVESMKRDYQRKSEDLQADGERAREDTFAPINQKLFNFAQGYTAKRGIVMLIDLANAYNSNTILWYDPRTDVTEDFINEYNKANPSSTGAQPVTPKP